MNAREHQTAPKCTAICPAGYTCGAATSVYTDNPCEPGRYCLAGSQYGAVCPRGTYSPAWGLEEKEECLSCPTGSECWAGATEHSLCPPGMFTATNGSELCMPCSRGQFQKESGQTACFECTAGFYCPHGSSTPVSCIAGTYSPDMGLWKQDQCRKVLPGFYSIVGSTEATPCPFGCYCPGADKDTRFRGASPIPIVVGDFLVERNTTVIFTHRVEEVSTTLTFDRSLSAVQGLLSDGRRKLSNGFLDTTMQEQVIVDELNALKEGLADIFEVPAGLVDLRLSELDNRVVVEVDITTGAVEDLAAVREVSAAELVELPDDFNATTIMKILESMEEGQLVAALSNVTTVLGHVKSVAEPEVLKLVINTTAEAMAMESFQCPVGHWCTAGELVPCPLSTWNNVTNVSSQTACQLCPKQSPDADRRVRIFQANTCGCATHESVLLANAKHE